MIRITSTLAALMIASSSVGAFASEVPWTKGVIKKIDKAQSKITVKHENIKNLDMPNMTMVFFAPDGAVLDNLEVGETREFEFGNLNGRLVVKQVKK